jgi:hypothetical protein
MPPAEPIAGAAEPVPDVPMQLQSLWAAAAPIASEPALSSNRGAGQQSEMQPQREQGEQVDEPSARPVPTAADQAADATSNVRFEHMLALAAAALALAAVIARKVFKLFAVRWLRRRRSALRSQWDAVSATRAPVPSVFANTIAAGRHADVAHDPVGATRSAHIARIEESLRLLLHDLRRAA